MKIHKHIKHPYQKIVYLIILTVIIYIGISGMFSLSLNPTTINLSIKAGGLAFYTIGALFLLTVFKAAFLEFVKSNSTRSKGQLIFQSLHKLLGWIIFLLAAYHSLFFIFYYLWPVEEMSISILITGLLAMIALMIVMKFGKNAIDRTLNYQSVYFKHVFATIVLIILTIIHLNFL